MVAYISIPKQYISVCDGSKNAAALLNLIDNLQKKVERTFPHLPEWVKQWVRLPIPIGAKLLEISESSFRRAIASLESLGFVKSEMHSGFSWWDTDKQCRIDYGEEITGTRHPARTRWVKIEWDVVESALAKRTGYPVQKEQDDYIYKKNNDLINTRGVCESDHPLREQEPREQEKDFSQSDTPKQLPLSETNPTELDQSSATSIDSYSVIEEWLSEIGVKVSQVGKAIATATQEVIERAIAATKQAIAQGRCASPVAFLKAAIKEKYEPLEEAEVIEITYPDGRKVALDPMLGLGGVSGHRHNQRRAERSVLAEGPWLIEGKLDPAFLEHSIAWWMRKFSASKHDAMGDVLAYFCNDPTKLQIRWQCYCAETNQRMENVVARSLSGGVITNEEKTYIETHQRALNPVAPEDSLVASPQQPEPLKPQAIPATEPAALQPASEDPAAGIALVKAAIQKIKNIPAARQESDFRISWNREKANEALRDPILRSEALRWAIANCYEIDYDEFGNAIAIQPPF